MIIVEGRSPLKTRPRLKIEGEEKQKGSSREALDCVGEIGLRMKAKGKRI
jgi:hypothetical protein